MLVSTDLRSRVAGIVSAALLAVAAALVLAALTPTAAQGAPVNENDFGVSDRECNTSHQIFMARLRAGGRTIGKVYVFREEGLLCAVTTRGYKGRPTSMEIRLWATRKNTVIHEGWDRGDFTMYAGRLRLPYAKDACWRVSGSIGNAVATTLSGPNKRGCLRV